MHWMIKCRSKSGTDELRTATIPSHIAHLDKFKASTWFSGPIFTDDGNSAIGSLRFIEFPDRIKAEEYIGSDPYTTEGIFETIIVERWIPSLNHRQLTYTRKEQTQQFILYCNDNEGSSPIRNSLREKHRTYLNSLSEKIIARGPLTNDTGDKIIGSVCLLDVSNRKEAEELWSNEPYNMAGVYNEITIERWMFGHV
ncbi:MAG: YciI family protein [Alphaproteobacteria bacterium]|nr:YciI family protein [Alphaproteobacteria bacterium]